MWYAQNFQCVPNSDFQNGKLIFPYSVSVKNTLDIWSIKFKMWPVLFSLNSPNFQQWNSNLHIIFQIILRFKTGIFVFVSQDIPKSIESLDSIFLQWEFVIFPDYESDVIMGFYNVSLSCIYFQISPNSLKGWKKKDIFEFHLL